jgi:GH25 family lysozyme M1 (1,4-beta-N-acetylmuramidase)
MIHEAIYATHPTVVTIDDTRGAFDVNGNQITIDWTKVNQQIPIVAFNKAMETLRAKRNKLLSDTDYLALSDNTMTEEVRTYRQALRDITEGLTTVAQVNAVVFPTKP